MNALKKNISEKCFPHFIGKPAIRWHKEDLCTLDYVLYGFAYDIFLGRDNIAIDVVIRDNTKKSTLSLLYPELKSKNKWRVMTVNKNLTLDFILNFINSEYIRITEALGDYSSFTPCLHYLGEECKLISASPIKMYFFDKVPNFGDLVGPWLASKLTRRPVQNVRNLSSSRDAIFGVGSIVNSISERHQNCRIWGSGLISDVNLNRTINKLREANLNKITAVRGRITGNYLRKHGFKVPEVYGDPALIFSELYSPNKINIEGNRVIVPHYIHYKYFKELNLEGYHIINVKDPITDVIDQIANAGLVISTSMHGLILAQSYQIPWSHLHIVDMLKLSGDDFKFNDFFTTLDSNYISQFKVKINDLNQNTLDAISSKVSLPDYDKSYRPESIIEAFYDALE